MGSKTVIAVLVVAAVCIGAFFYGISYLTSSRIYESTGTVSSTTYRSGPLSIECTKIRFIATDFIITAYGRYDSLQVGHKYTFTYWFDMNDIATVISYTEVN